MVLERKNLCTWFWFRCLNLKTLPEYRLPLLRTAGNKRLLFCQLGIPTQSRSSLEGRWQAAHPRATGRTSYKLHLLLTKHEPILPAPITDNRIPITSPCRHSLMHYPHPTARTSYKLLLTSYKTQNYPTGTDYRLPDYRLPLRTGTH